MTRLKKSIAWILSAVLILTVVSGAVLYVGGDQSGSITSTDKVKYDHIVDTSISLQKDIQPYARNGSLKLIGSACYEYSEVILTASLNQTVGEQLTELIGSGGVSMFQLSVPSEFLISSNSSKFDVYLCWDSELDPEQETYRYYVGAGNKIKLDSYPDNYAQEECWLEVCSNDSTTILFTKLVVQMIPYTYPSGVSTISVTSKNLIDYLRATAYGGAKLSFVDNGVVMPKDATYYVEIPCNLPAGSYTVSYSGSNESGDTVDKYTVVYTDGTTSSGYLVSGSSGYFGSDIKAIRIYKRDPKDPLFEDLIIRNIQVERGYTATEYTPYFVERMVLDIPLFVQNLPDYGVGSGVLYNYIDLTRSVYVQTCTLIDTEVVPLDTLCEFDISAYLPPGSGNIDLYGVGTIIFYNPENVDVPSEVAYRRVIN